MNFDVDVLLIGGGIAGLWTLDELRRRGLRAVLVENQALGTGQTISSQGIIHGGLKYSLRGLLTASASEIREMPLVWRECLSGDRQPDLSATDVRSHHCYLWQTSALSSQAGMLGAQLNLQVKPRAVTPQQRPDLLKNLPGQVFRLDEQVLSPASLLECLRTRNESALLKVDAENGVDFQLGGDRRVEAVTLTNAQRTVRLRPRFVIMSAGAGNQLLSENSGQRQPMQHRPLHMVLARGPMPMFQGHCVDGAKTRLTITSEVLDARRTVWQLGGQIAEQGVGQTCEQLIEFAAHELAATLPGLNLNDVEFATYRIDRAERKSGMGLRPDGPQILRHKNAFTIWPTKLAFAPRVAQLLCQTIGTELGTETGAIDSAAQAPTQGTLLQELSNWPRPQVAANPWQQVRQWFQVAGGTICPSDVKPSQRAA